MPCIENGAPPTHSCAPAPSWWLLDAPTTQVGLYLPYFPSLDVPLGPFLPPLGLLPSFLHFFSCKSTAVEPHSVVVVMGGLGWRVREFVFSQDQKGNAELRGPLPFPPLAASVSSLIPTTLPQLPVPFGLPVSGLDSSRPPLISLLSFSVFHPSLPPPLYSTPDY